MTVAILILVILLALALLLGVYGVKVTLGMSATAVETLDATLAPYLASGSDKVTHSGLNVSAVLDANSVAGTNVTAMGGGSVAMVAGVATINLAAVPKTQGTADLTGLKVRFILIRAKAANANPITIAKGAANGYTGFGADFSVTLDPGKSVIVEANATAVAAGVRLLDITGTAAQGLDYMVFAGAN